MHDVREQWSVLSSPLARRPKSCGIELICDEYVTEVLTCGLQALIGLEIAHELLLPVGPDAPLRGDEGASASGKEGEIDLLHLFRRRRRMEARQVVQNDSRPNLNA